MAKGNGKQFRDLMENIPSRQMRAEITATAIRDMLSSGKRGADFNPAGFADWYQNLVSSGQIRTLAQHVPKELMIGLRDVNTVADAIRRAKGHEVTTGALNEFVARFNRVTASHDLIAKYAGRIGTMAGTKGGPFGALAGAALGEKIAEKARLAGGAASADAAEKLISSSAYQKVVRSLPNSAPPTVIENRIRSNANWRNFYDSLPEKDRRMIARIGLVAWLSGQIKENEY